MCGIFGILSGPASQLTGELTVKALASLYRHSETRGKESAGLHLYSPGAPETITLKGDIPATELLRAPDYRKITAEIASGAYRGQAPAPYAEVILAHSRLVTNGSANLPQNNQPVHANGVTTIHNGIVVNVDALWAERPHLQRHAEVDTEVLSAIMADEVGRGAGPVAATRAAYRDLRGAASIGWVHHRGNWAVLATNTGDLYYRRDDADQSLVFASERHILEKGLEESGLAPKGGAAIDWLPPGQALHVDLDTFTITPFALADGDADTLHAFSLQPQAPAHRDLAIRATSGRVEGFTPLTPGFDSDLIRYDEQRVRSLRRCSRCVLPETFPYIRFDAQGVCNYCHNYKPRYKGKDPKAEQDRFVASLEKYRSKNGMPDAIVPFSGGRDSSYGLHLIKKEFGFNPITFTYDWGMVTDLARRNVARMCGELGVQNILVSANIKQKRENIRKNVSAWLHRPALGIVPLFMAGDKHFFSIVNQIKRQTGIRTDLWCANPLENTDFKSGFCNVPPDFEKERLDYLSSSRKLKMAAYYGVNFLRNPRYINSSMLDTLGAFSAYYFEPRRDFFFVFDHLVWNEQDVNRVLLDDYDWELATDTDSTWRIGDGTAPFYNYIYLTARGFSEFDTFRSNQIREGMVTREEALQAVFTENRPRPQSIKWYLDAIGLDFDTTIRRINELGRPE